MTDRNPLRHNGFRGIPPSLRISREVARTVLKTVEPVSRFRGFKSHSLRQRPRKQAVSGDQPSILTAIPLTLGAHRGGECPVFGVTAVGMSIGPWGGCGLRT